MNTKYLFKGIIFAGLMISGMLCSCEKAFLDAKPDKSLLVPTTVEHYQALLDNALNVMNLTPYLGEVSADDFYMAPNTFESYQETEQNAYIWADRIYPTLSVQDWDLPYKQVFYANVVLDGLTELPSNDEAVQNLRGSALFYRAWALFQTVQLFGAAYNPEDAGGRKGVPVRVSADVALPSEVGTLRDTYERIKSDLRLAIPLLQVRQAVFTRPSKTAAYALMARLFLVMQDYPQARLYADSTLTLQSELLDYNTLDPAKPYPMPVLYGNTTQNPEVIFLSILVPNIYLGSSNNTLVDTALYNLYSKSDLRKTLFFNASGLFRGSYIGERRYQFSGLAVDEMYLIRAECYARSGDMEKSSADLNALLARRWKGQNFDPIQINDREKLLLRVLEERRKELIARGIRWSDLKRLNQDPRFDRTLKRVIHEKEYVLPPNDARYTLPVPDAEVAF